MASFLPSNSRFVYGQNQNIALGFDGSGTLTNRYLHGNSIDEVLADEANGSVGWALTDNLGSVRDVVDATGTSQNHVVFDSFGNVTSETNPSFKTRFSFTGREFDAETGNYDYRSRSYNPGSGRFIEEDPISFATGDANLYRYVGNSPAHFIDPFGLRPALRTIDDLPGGRMGGSVGGGGLSGIFVPKSPVIIQNPTPIDPRFFPRVPYYTPSNPRIVPILPGGTTGGVFDGQDFYNPNMFRSNVDREQLTEEQQSVLKKTLGA